MLSAPTGAAQAAAVGEKAFQIAARAIAFTEAPLEGEVELAIVFSPANPVSAAEAADLQKLMGAGLRAGKILFKPVLVPLDKLAQTPEVGAFYVTGGLGQSAEQVIALCRQRQRLCITTDLSQVENGRCVIAIQAEPRVEITVAADAARDCGVVFRTTFRMMIREI